MLNNVNGGGRSEFLLTLWAERIDIFCTLFTI